ncbi:MAG: hypothetical protein SOS98_03885 [Varibaculum sp.]|nr:hypothetical protein [Varibaculum sp.]
MRVYSIAMQLKKPIQNTAQIYAEVSALIGEYLSKSGLNLAQLGTKMGISRQKASQRMSNKTRWTLDEVSQLANLGVISPVDLFRIMKGSADE